MVPVVINHTVAYLLMRSQHIKFTLSRINMPMYLKHMQKYSSIYTINIHMFIIFPLFENFILTDFVMNEHSSGEKHIK